MAIPIIKKPHELRHPNYVVNQENWRKWRLSFEGGDRFIRQYLKRMSRREGDVEFAERLAISYCPAFAKAAIRDVINSIFARMGDITRVGGSDDYQSACAGVDFGIDYLGNSMTSFMARRILPELTSMARVGIYVDMPPVDDTSKAAVKGKRPYIYWYRAEDILDWEMDCGDRPGEFTNVLLGDTTIEDDPDAYLPTNEVRRYRHMWIGDDGYVWVQFYDLDGRYICYGPDNDENGPIRLNITRIPFHMLELPESLMSDVANYQIALLNMASADVNYSIRSNFPFYVEQFDARTETPNIKSEAPNQYFSQTSGYNPATASVQIVNQESGNVVRVGSGQGRKYPLGTNQPAFIHPSSEPLEASMKKQAQLKAEIRELINLAITSLTTSKSDVGAFEANFDEQSLESGLAYIGLELEIAERKIAEFWAMYEGGNPADVYYPKNYTLTTEEQRLASATEYIDLIPKLPSKTYQKEMAKIVIRKLLEHKVPQATLQKMYAEIDSAVVIAIDPEVIQSDFESGLVGLETASKARGYPTGEVEKAKGDHADRVARIAIAQSEGGGAGAPAKNNPDARGTGDLSSNSKGATQEKKASTDTTTDSTVKDKQRGEGK